MIFPETSIRETILYLDAFYPNMGYGKTVHENSLCECGNYYAVEFIPRKICRSCRFSQEMEKIEFGPDTINYSC